MKNFLNIYIAESCYFLVILLISFFYFLLSPNLILLTLLIFLFFLINLYLISSFNKGLDEKINTLKTSFTDLVSSNIKILNLIKEQIKKSFDILNLSSSVYYLFYFKKLIFKFYSVNFNLNFLGNLLFLTKFFISLINTKKVLK